MTTEVPAYRPVPLKGMPLAVKLTLVVAALVALFMAAFGALLHGRMEDTIRAQIQHEAVNAARAASLVDLDAWSWSFATIDQGLDADQIQARVDAETLEQFTAYDTDPERKARVAWNQGRFGRALGDDTRILAFEVFRWEDGRRGPTVGSAYPRVQGAARAEFEAMISRPPVFMGAGQVQEGVLTVGEVDWHSMRGSYPIAGPDGEQAGEVVVHVHAAAIGAAAKAFSERVTYAGVAFMGVSALLAWLFATRLTSPVRRLRDDVEAVMEGDLDHRTHPHSSDEIGQLARTFETMTRWLAQARDAEDEAEAEADSMADELAAAADVTASLFPRRLPSLPGFTLGGLHDREASPGGGTYDVLELPGGRLGVFVAEASANGAPGALVAAMARSIVRLAAERHEDPGAVLRDVNARLSPDLGSRLTVAALYLVIEPSTGRVRVANAGHRPLLHLRAVDDSLRSVRSAGAALGAAEGRTFDEALSVHTLELGPGDGLVAFASQITLLTSEEGEVLGEKRLAALVKQASSFPAHELVERVGQTLRRFHGGPSLGADVTLFAVRRDG